MPGLVSFPHTTPDRFLIGGPSNAGALFVDWARQLLRGAPKPGPDREKLAPRLGDPERVPVWLPYIRGERTPFEDHTLRSNIYGLDIGSGAEAIERAAFEASGFVVQRMLEMADVKATRHRGEWRRVTGHRVDVGRGRRHRTPRRDRRRARGGSPWCGLFRPDGGGTRVVARRLSELGRGRATDRA